MKIIKAGVAHSKTEWDNDNALLQFSVTTVILRSNVTKYMYSTAELQTFISLDSDAVHELLELIRVNKI